MTEIEAIRAHLTKTTTRTKLFVAVGAMLCLSAALVLYLLEAQVFLTVTLGCFALLLIMLWIKFMPTYFEIAKQLESNHPELHNSITAALEGGKYSELSASFAVKTITKITTHVKTPRYIKIWLALLATFLLVFALSSITSTNPSPVNNKKTVAQTPVIKNKVVAPQKSISIKKHSESKAQLLTASPEGFAGAVESFIEKQNK